MRKLGLRAAVLAAGIVCAVGAVFASELPAQQSLAFTLLHTNDEHSTLLPAPLSDYDDELPNPTRGGFARLAQAVADIRAAKAAVNEPVLLVSAGDILGGSAFAWLALEDQAAELQLMQEIGYDVMTLGNHEFDYGPEHLAQYLAVAGYPSAHRKTALVASNIVIPEGHPLEAVGLLKTHLVTLDNGLKIGFFGLMGVHAEQVAPLAKPIRFSDRVEAADAAVAELRLAGADVVVAITHSGVEEDKALATAVAGIDVIVGGHTHETLPEPVVAGSTLIVQTGSLLQNLGVLELAYDSATGQVRLRNEASGQPYLVELDHHIGQHPQIAARVEAYTQALNATVSRLSGGRFNDIRETVLESEFIVANGPQLSETPLGNFVTDAMRLAAEQATGERVDFAFQANGVIRGSVVPGSLPHSQNQVTFLDLVNLVGLGSGLDGTAGYPMVSVYLTGQEVRRVLEISVLLGQLMGNTHFLQVSGLRMSYDPARAILATIPIKNIPVPSTRAVLSAERYVGDGVQGEQDYVALSRDDDSLYHVVSDYYVASSLPLVGKLLPSLGLVLKDRDGNPISPEQAIVYRDGKELKVWQAVAEYAAAQPVGENGLPRMSDYYRTSAGRLVQTAAMPLLAYPALALLVVVGGIVVLAFWRRRRRTAVAA